MHAFPKWFAVLAVGVFALVLIRFWREILIGIATVAVIAVMVGLLAALARAGGESRPQGPPGWWWADQAEQRREAERAEQEAVRADQEAERASERAAELAAWNEYQRNR
jgi:hypothetical protein